MTYEAIPFLATPERADVTSRILRAIVGHETVFNDFQRGCEEECYREKDVAEMCPQCRGRMELVAAALLRPDARSWEVWRVNGEAPELAGLIRISRIVPGMDAVGHYVFFDNDLRGKTKALKSIIGWLFEDHEEEGWHALPRLTVEIPDFAYALARHAHKRLGFGGNFEWKPPRGKAIAVEGVKREVIPWRGQKRDLLILGLQRN